jgi:hypothetical protein
MQVSAAGNEVDAMHAVAFMPSTDIIASSKPGLLFCSITACSFDSSLTVCITLNLALHCCMVTSPGLARCLGLVTRTGFGGQPPLALDDKDRQVCRGSA